MRSKVSDIPVAIQRVHPDVTNKSFGGLKSNLLFMNKKCYVCENCFFILRDINEKTADDMKVIAYQGKINYKLVK
jgi:hypothetical protein